MKTLREWMDIIETELDEVRLVPSLSKADKLDSPYVMDDFKWSPEHLTKFDFEMIGKTGTHEVWEKFGRLESEFVVINAQTRLGDLSVCGEFIQHAGGGRSFMVDGLAGRDGSRIKAHEFYAWLIKERGYIICSSDIQSVGGMKVWQKLQQTPGINVHAWEPGKKLAHNMKVGPSTHQVQDDEDDEVAPGLNIWRKGLVLVAHAD